jgi:O-antigen/teichoic acid export membrane protein
LLRDLIATLRAYYFYVGLAVLGLLMVGGGIWIWFTTRPLPEAGALRLAWFVYAGGCWLNFVVGRWPALLSGIGAVRDAQVAASVAFLLYYALVSAGLLAGLGIWALVIAYVVMGFVARHLGRRFFTERARLPDGLPRAHFHRDIFHSIWPNAWRTGMVSVGAFLTVYANTLICSAFLSLTITAAYGLSFQLVSMLFGLCNVWVSVKLPNFNMLRQQGRTAEIVQLFARRMRLAILSYVAGMLVILFFAPWLLHFLKSKTTLIAAGPLAALAVFRLLELHHSLYAVLVFTENQNPFLKQSLVSGAAIVVAGIVLTPAYGLWGLILSMGLVQLCYNNWWPVLRALKGLNLKPRDYFLHHYLRPKAWLELF